MACHEITEKPEQVLRAAAAAAIDETASAALRNEAYPKELELSLKNKNTVAAGAKSYEVGGKYCLSLLGNMEAEGKVKTESSQYEFKSKGNILKALVSGLPGDVVQKSADGKSTVKSGSGNCTADIKIGSVEANCKANLKEASGKESAIGLNYQKDKDGNAVLSLELAGGKKLEAKIEYLSPQKDKARLSFK